MSNAFTRGFEGTRFAGAGAVWRCVSCSERLGRSFSRGTLEFLLRLEDEANAGHQLVLFSGSLSRLGFEQIA